MSALAGPCGRRFTLLGVVGLALLLYAGTAAPGLTWSHQGADGGDLLAAAATNGVPHPSGYPLYTLLMQGWLTLGRRLTGFQPARLGALLSVLCAALSSGFTLSAAGALLAPRPNARLWAALATLAWIAAPLLWGQALIAEVYALHALLAAAIGWAVLTGRRAALAVALGLGLAHHITSLLLWPAVIFWLWTQPGVCTRTRFTILATILSTAVGLGGLFYARIPWAAAAAPPVNWGYADNPQGFWWLVSGEAYRDYLFGIALDQWPGRIAAWARVLAAQFTPLGLGIALAGLAGWDRTQARLRTFGLLWAAPLSVYAMGYATVDSRVYLLPVVWMAALWFANGLVVGVDWLQERGMPRAVPGAAGVVLAGLVITALVRMPEMTLRHDRAAEDFLDSAAATLEPGSLVISRTDAPTFALWYGVWGSDRLAEVPDLVLVNDALYVFDWYRRLLADLYPHVPGMGGSFADLLAANRRVRPIYLAESLPDLPGTQEPVGLFWRYEPSVP